MVALQKSQVLLVSQKSQVLLVSQMSQVLLMPLVYLLPLPLPAFLMQLYFFGNGVCGSASHALCRTPCCVQGI